MQGDVAVGPVVQLLLLLLLLLLVLLLLRCLQDRDVFADQVGYLERLKETRNQDKGLQHQNKRLAEYVRSLSLPFSYLASISTDGPFVAANKGSGKKLLTNTFSLIRSPVRQREAVSGVS